MLKRWCWESIANLPAPTCLLSALFTYIAWFLLAEKDLIHGRVVKWQTVRGRERASFCYESVTQDGADIWNFWGQLVNSRRRIECLDWWVKIERCWWMSQIFQWESVEIFSAVLNRTKNLFYLKCTLNFFQMQSIQATIVEFSNAMRSYEILWIFLILRVLKLCIILLILSKPCLWFHKL